MRTIRKSVIVKLGGLIELSALELSEGTRVEVIVSRALCTVSNRRLSCEAGRLDCGGELGGASKMLKQMPSEASMSCGLAASLNKEIINFAMGLLSAHAEDKALRSVLVRLGLSIEIHVNEATSCRTLQDRTASKKSLQSALDALSELTQHVYQAVQRGVMSPVVYSRLKLISLELRVLIANKVAPTSERETGRAVDHDLAVSG